MAEEKSIGEVYLESAKRLRASLPKFVIFMGTAYLIWLIGTTFLVKHGTFIGAIEAAKLESLAVLAATLVLILASFIEIREVADSMTGITISFIANRESKFKDVRFLQLRRAFRNIGYIVPFIVSSFMFSNILGQIHPLINLVVPVLIAVWVVVALVTLAMVLGIEIEESAREFKEKLERRIKKK